jgi:hypothetical protein
MKSQKTAMISMMVLSRKSVAVEVSLKSDPDQYGAEACSLVFFQPSSLLVLSYLLCSRRRQRITSSRTR